MSQLEDLIKRLNNCLASADSIKKEDLIELWLDNIKRIDNVPKVRDPSSENGKRWLQYAKEKGLLAKNKGNEELNAGRNDSAVVWFTIAASLEPENHIYTSNRSAAYANMGKYHEALNDAQKTIELNPNWARGYGRKGLACFNLQKYDEALAAYRKGVELEPDNDSLKAGLQQANAKVQAEESNVLGEEFLAKGKLNEAVKAFDRAIQHDNNEALYYANKSDAYLRADMPDKALEDADKTISLRPNWFKGYVRRGDALRRMDKYDEAAASYGTALQLDPSNSKLQSEITNTIQAGVQYRYRKNMEQHQQKQ